MSVSEQEVKKKKIDNLSIHIEKLDEELQTKSKQVE